MKKSRLVRIAILCILIGCGALYKTFNIYEYCSLFLYKSIFQIVPAKIIIEGASPKSKVAIENIVYRKSSGAFQSLNVRNIYNRLISLPWIAHLEIRYKYPSHVIISIIEETPYAVYYKGKKLYLISKEGKFLEEVKHSAGYVLVSGNQANTRVNFIIDILAQYDGLLNNVHEIKLRNNRRWDINICGTTILLPEMQIKETIDLFYELFYKTDVYSKFSKIDFRISGKVYTTSK